MPEQMLERVQRHPQVTAFDEGAVHTTANPIVAGEFGKLGNRRQADLPLNQDARGSTSDPRATPCNCLYLAVFTRLATNRKRDRSRARFRALKTTCLTAVRNYDGKLVIGQPFSAKSCSQQSQHTHSAHQRC
jgi:hypothetical protein